MSPIVPTRRRFSPRDLQILQAAADGLRAKDTAQRVKLSPKYVKNRRRQIAQKLGADNITQAVAMGIRRGIIQ